VCDVVLSANGWNACGVCGVLLREVDETKGSAARISSRSFRVRSREVEVSSRREVERSESRERDQEGHHEWLKEVK